MDDTTEYLATHRFADLFRAKLGWTGSRTRGFKLLDGTFVRPIAHRHGFIVFTCEVRRSDLGNRNLLYRHQRELRRQFHELILIHYCLTSRKQVWQWVTGASNGRRLARREPTFFSNRPPHGLLERLEKLATGREDEDELPKAQLLNSVRAALLPTSELDAFDRGRRYAGQYDRLMMELKAGKPDAFSELVDSYLPLMRKAARKLAGRFGIDKEDGQQMAIMALLELVQRFDPKRHPELPIHLGLRLGNKCRRKGLKWSLPILVHYSTYSRCRVLGRVREELVASYGESECGTRFEAELSKVDISLEQWEDVCRARQLEYFSDIAPKQLLSLVDYHDREGSEDTILAADSVAIVQKAISSLKPRQQLILKMRYGMGQARQTLHQVADVLGVTFEAVRQMQNSTEKKLAKKLQLEGFDFRLARRNVKAGELKKVHRATRKVKS